MSDEGIQFESAEFAPEAGGASSCSACGEGLSGQYWTANGHPVCATCQQGLASLDDQGSALGRAVRGVALGLLASLVCAALWFAIIKLTDAQWGIIAIAVGFLVGKAVSIGSGGKGGWFYQLAAIGLSYLAIVFSYVPFLRDQIQAEGDLEGPLAWIAAAIIAIPAPFLTGAQGLIGLLIIGIALYYAWKINARRMIALTGPHDLATMAEPAPPPPAPLPPGPSVE